MKLHTKLIIALMASLFVVVAVAQLFQYFSMKNQIFRYSESNIGLLKEREKEFAENIFKSVERAVAGSLERGEMEKFTKLLSAQREVKGLLEFSLYDKNGVVTHSSDPSFLKKSIKEKIRKQIEDSPEQLLLSTEGAIEIYKPQMVNSDCIRCHYDWKAGEIGGITHFRFSLESLTKAKSHAAKSIADMKSDTIMNSAFIVAAILLVLVVSMYFLIKKLVARPLNSIIVNFKNITNQVSLRAGQVSSSSKQLADGSSNQAASIEETSSSLEEMSSMTKQNAENAKQADGHMKEANQVVSQANDSMTELITSMEEISKASQETSKIVKTIDEIAFQTNLLALNAAVEAARAGEAGVGFAVVADEVRNLSMRAAEAAKNTAGLIEGTMKKVADGSELVSKTNEAFTQVAESSQKVGELVGEIATASNEQTQGIEQTNTAVAEMDKVVQQNAANAEESASASEEMNAQAEQMKAMVNELATLVGGNVKHKPAG